MLNIKEFKRRARHVRVRGKVRGTTQRPRLCVHRSLNNIYAQIIDDVAGKILFGVSTLDKDVRGKLKTKGNIQAATLLGETLALKAKNKGITKVAFDRGGYLYHGRIKAFAEAARKGGLES